SQHFGYAPVYAAVVAHAPSKVEVFNANSNPQFMGAGGVQMQGSVGSYLNFTPEEIYLDFRTMPVGALGTTGALYETGVVMSTAVGVAYIGGYTAGSGLAY